MSEENPLVIDDPFTEAQKRQLEEALHFQNALVDLLGEPNEKLEPWALAKIKAMQDALPAASPDPRRSVAEIRAEIDAVGQVRKKGGYLSFRDAGYLDALRWVLNEQEMKRCTE